MELKEEKLQPEIHDFVINKIREGLAPSKSLRAMHEKFGEQNLHKMCASLGEAYNVEPFDILVCLGHWWFDSSSDVTDEELDRWIFKMAETVR